MKDLSQGDLENRTGLLRCYISRVENGHTVPALETLEKLARALEVPMYQLFYEDKDNSSQPESEAGSKARQDWASRGRGRRLFVRLRSALSRASDRDRALVLTLAMRIASVKRKVG